MLAPRTNRSSATDCCSSARAPLAFAAPFSFRDALTSGWRGLGHSASPTIARYQTDEGSVFVLDRSPPHVLLKFDDSPEIWVLAPSPGGAAALR